MTMAKLFEALDIGPIRVPNRIAVAPMCQYSAQDGAAADWHAHHWPTLGMSGAGLVMIEMTDVERRGRITHGCLGLYSDDNERAFARTLAAARAAALPGVKFGVQIAHAGRKGSSQRPWEGGQPLGPKEDPWTLSAPSAIAFNDGWPEPEALAAEAIEALVVRFGEAAARAERAGVDLIELHMAHGYLLHQFLSPIANHRQDGFGAADRMRFPLMAAAAVKAAASGRIALGARITGSDWSEDGIKPADAVTLALELKRLGFHYVDVTSGAIHPKIAVPAKPGFQVPLAEEVRRGAGLVTRAVGLIADPHQAEAILASGAADQVAIGRGILDDPRWGWHAAEALGVKPELPPQYARAAASVWAGASLARHAGKGA
jgi:2,4-dienoyl-CoA reductase-like NADH-dependent reductase (Old Yellow Enzyme family)